MDNLLVRLLLIRESSTHAKLADGSTGPGDEVARTLEAAMSTTMAAFYEGGGDYMHCISACAVIGAAISLDRLWALLVRHNIRPARFFHRIKTAILAGEINRAIELCDRAERAALAQVIRAGLRRGDCPKRAAVAMDEATLTVQPMIAGRGNAIRGIANIAMLIGLLGTVFGMILGFHCTSMSVDERASVLMHSIALAIHTTGYALMVAIPLNAVVIVLNTQSSHLADDLALYAAKLNRLLREPRANHRVLTSNAAVSQV